MRHPEARAWGRALRFVALVAATTMAGELLLTWMALAGWSRPDAAFLAALFAGACTTAAVVAFAVLRLRAGAGRAGPSRTARWAAIAGVLVAAWLTVAGWLEGGAWSTPHLPLWLWPGALLLSPAPTWLLEPALDASWLVVAMAVNGLVYGLAATVVHLVIDAMRAGPAAVPPELCAAGLVLGVLSWLTPAVVPADAVTAAVATLGLGGLALGVLAPRHGALAAAVALPGLLVPALVEMLAVGGAAPLALVVAREVVRATAVASAGVGAALAGGGVSRLVAGPDAAHRLH